MHRKVAAALVVALVALVGAGCGSDEEPLTRAQLVRQSDAICAQLQRRAQTLIATAARAARGGERFETSGLGPRVAELLDDTVDDLEGLTPPDELSDEFDQYVEIQKQRAEAYDDGKQEVDGDVARPLARIIPALGFRTCN